MFFLSLIPFLTALLIFNNIYTHLYLNCRAFEGDQILIKTLIFIKKT